MRYIALLLLGAAALEAASIDIYPAKELQGKGATLTAKKTAFSSETLKNWGSHYSMLAHRETTGSAEVHEKETDIFVIESGSGDLLTGGKVVKPHTEKAGEIRGPSIEGGDKHAFAKGDVIHIPAGVPHQMLVDKGEPVTYFVVKVIEQ